MALRLCTSKQVLQSEDVGEEAFVAEGVCDLGCSDENGFDGGLGAGGVLVDFGLYFLNEAFSGFGGTVFDFAKVDDVVSPGEEEIDLGSGVLVGTAKPGAIFVTDGGESEFSGNEVGMGQTESLKGKTTPWVEFFVGKVAGCGLLFAGLDLFESGLDKPEIEQQVGIAHAVSQDLGMQGSADGHIAFDKATQFQFFEVLGQGSASIQFATFGNGVTGEVGIFPQVFEDLAIVEIATEVTGKESLKLLNEITMPGKAELLHVEDEGFGRVHHFQVLGDSTNGHVEFDNFTQVAFGKEWGDFGQGQGTQQDFDVHPAIESFGTHDFADHEGGNAAAENEMHRKIRQPTVPEEFEAGDQVHTIGRHPLKFVQKDNCGFPLLCPFRDIIRQ